MVRTPYYEGWESDIVWQVADLFEANIGAPKVLDARQALSSYPPVHIIYATPRLAQCRDIVDWDSLRPALRHLFETYGEVWFEFGGHDDLRNVWFHCVKWVYNNGISSKYLAAIFFVTGLPQVKVMKTETETF